MIKDRSSFGQLKYSRKELPELHCPKSLEYRSRDQSAPTSSNQLALVQEKDDASNNERSKKDENLNDDNDT